MARKRCPKCGSTNVAKILYGLQPMSPELEENIRKGKIVLGGCCVYDSDCHCNLCGHEWVYEAHPFHKEVGKRLVEIQQAVTDHQLVLDHSCESELHGECIPFFSNIGFNGGPTKDESRHYCDVDAIFINRRGGPSIDVVIEIEESGITPIKVCGKFMTSALSDHCIHYAFGNRPVPFTKGALFIQVLLRTEAMMLDRSDMGGKMWNIEKSIRAVVKKGNYAFSDYAMVMGDMGEFESPGGDAYIRLKDIILDRLVPSARISQL